jgi:hypothetical protein
MNDIDKLVTFLKGLPDTYVVLLDDERVDVDKSGLWLKKTKDYIFYDMISCADITDDYLDIVATINVHGSIYEIKVAEMVDRATIFNLLKNISEL